MYRRIRHQARGTNSGAASRLTEARSSSERTTKKTTPKEQPTFSPRTYAVPGATMSPPRLCQFCFLRAPQSRIHHLHQIPRRLSHLNPWSSSRTTRVALQGVFGFIDGRGDVSFRRVRRGDVLKLLGAIYLVSFQIKFDENIICYEHKQGTKD